MALFKTLEQKILSVWTTEVQKYLYLGFIDYTKAFDMAQHKELTLPSTNNAENLLHGKWPIRANSCDIDQTLIPQRLASPGCSQKLRTTLRIVRTMFWKLISAYCIVRVENTPIHLTIEALDMVVSHQ